MNLFTSLLVCLSNRADFAISVLLLYTLHKRGFCTKHSMKNKMINKENISTNSIRIKITTYKEGKLTELPGY